MPDPRLLLPALAVLLVSAGSPAAANPYPTDRCVAQKLEAAADFCAESFRAASRGRPATARVERRLEQAWQRAEDKSEAAGVDCAQTTESADAVADLIATGANELRSLLGKRSGRRQMTRAGRLCQSLLLEDARELRSRHRFGAVERGAGGPPTSGARNDADSDSDSDSSSDSDSGDRPRAARRGGSAIADGVESLVTSVVEALTISPYVSTEWTVVQFEADEQVEYEGRTWEPTCWDGAPYRLYVKRGTVNKLVMYYQGGGACWDFFTCNPGLPTFKTGTGDFDNPANFSSGFTDPDNPANLFRDWHQVFVPYCTADIHWGDQVVVHSAETAQGGTVSTTVRHYGFHNTRMAEKYAREHFVAPEQVFVTGSSAGAYGALANSVWLMEEAYPTTPFAVVGDAGNGIVTQEFLANEISKWGVDTVLPDWIPELNVPLTELSMAQLYVSAAETYPRNRFASYTTAFDGSSGGQTGFYNIMLNPIRDLDNDGNLDLGIIAQVWPRWWEASCEWNAEMRALNAVTSVAPNYRYYVGTGSRHTMWGANKVYDDTTGGVPTIVDWLADMLDGADANWQSVECRNCGLLLPGDPRPNPLEPPFTQVGPDVVIDCPGTP